MIRVAAIGECMVELRHRDDDTLAIGFAGDTYNTAVYLSRSAPTVSVDYVTIIGDDWYSDRMLAAMREEGIGVDRVDRRPASSPGLYLVRTDDEGERRFSYHRDNSPARTLFANGHIDLSPYDVVYLSAVTVQIMTGPARKRLWAALGEVETVAFDSNYRASGWPDLAAARAAIESTLAVTSIALPTFSDEQSLYGDPDVTACLDRLEAYGVREIVVKDGANGCTLSVDGVRTFVPATRVDAVVDTTAAGDSFNGGYLGARLTGASPESAALAGHVLASLVIQHPGAILPAEILPRRK